MAKNDMPKWAAEQKADREQSDAAEREYNRASSVEPSKSPRPSKAAPKPAPKPKKRTADDAYNDSLWSMKKGGTVRGVGIAKRGFGCGGKVKK